jgi:transposase
MIPVPSGGGGCSWRSATFLWPSPADGIVVISAAQLAYMLDGIDWRNPVRTWRPEAAG